MSVFIDQPLTTRASVGTFHAISFCASSGALSSASLHGGVGLVDIEALAGLDADPLHLRDDRLVGEMRRIELEQLGRVGEVLGPPACVSTWTFGGVFMSTRRIDLHLDRLGRLAPLARAA